MLCGVQAKMMSYIRYMCYFSSLRSVTALICGLGFRFLGNF